MFVDAGEPLPRLAFRYVRGPSHCKTLLDALVDRTIILMIGERAVGFGFFSGRNFEMVMKFDGGQAKQLAVRFDAAFDVGHQIIGCGYSARFQRAGKCAGQSTSKGRNDVIDGGGEFLRRVHTIKPGIAPVHSKVQRLLEPFNVRFAKGPLLLHQFDSCRVNEFAHKHLQAKRCQPEQKVSRAAQNPHLSY
jgi:hypothetical protein